MSSKWQLLETLARFENPWLTLIGERLRDDAGQNLTYWRVERTDSVIIIPIYQENFILPKEYYRHGLGKMTFDFPGGRHDPKLTLEQSAYRILDKELKIKSDCIKSMSILNPHGWNVDSSFSSQKVFAFAAQILDSTKLNHDLIEMTQPADYNGAKAILDKLDCLQCRCALLEWMCHYK